jgi:hypothetical protein
MALRVLVVDDCRDTVDTTIVLLRRWGYEGAAAYDGGPPWTWRSSAARTWRC